MNIDNIWRLPEGRECGGGGVEEEGKGVQMVMDGT